LKAYLSQKGYTVFLAVDGQAALDSYQNDDVDACILDIMMPIKDGFTVAKEIRRVDKRIPIIFLTAKNLEADKLKGFEIGADDYVTKPFSMDELLARVKAIYRRCSYVQAQPSTYQLGSFSFNAPRHELVKGDEVHKLTSKESDLLLMLCENMGNTLERSKALQQIWNEDSYLNARSMDVYITKLRKYFKDDPNVDIQNVHGVGFKLVVK
jgi:DNA-binding response OmpR family regulator